jgi:hypothetical protein
MVTESVNRLIINVKKAIKPCHKPIQNPAVVSMKCSFPGAHEFKRIAIEIKMIK